MSQNPDMPLPVNSTPTLTTCSNCHSPMPSELRFCRNCGFRLGDGLADYQETVRFGGERGPLAAGAVSTPVPVRKRRKMSGMAWVFIGLLVFFIGAAAENRSEEHTSELQSQSNLVCRLLLEK